MPPSSSRKRFKIIGAIVVVIVIGIGAFILFQPTQEEPAPASIEEEPVVTRDVIGRSVEGREIRAFTYGDGPEELLFVGGIHGGYEWNSVILAYQVMDYFEEHPDAVPDNLSVSIIPSLNPDGVFAVTGVEGRFTQDDVPDAREATVPGRFNARDVDLNRNFACKWQPTSTWRGETVSAGTEAFSEPEALALRNFIEEREPAMVVFWHSQSNAVYASECHEGVLPETLDIMHAYSRASGYPAVESFDAYPITGDAEGWLASIGIPALTVELSTHNVVEFERNLSGVEALLNYYSQ